ncbi:type 4a pilus biogenesis protein PilO [Candidatus Electronema sp. PJ]|uniref:type 4a pilus biogenesis protein PilO n=1 Tax=Candidatus Electronema sp. PJ TaxID=3401572 RepID=UPI003AA86240
MASEKIAAKLDKFINEKYIPLNKNIKLGLALGIPVLLITAFYFLFFSSKQEEIGTLQNQKNELTNKVNEAQKAADNLSYHKEELESSKKKFEEISIVLPKEHEIPDLLRNISDIGKRAGLDFIEFKPGSESPKDFYAEIPISIKINGPYHNMGYFLGEVSGLERLVTVDNIKMGSPKEIEGEMLLDSSCNLLTYRFTGQAAAPPQKSNNKPEKGKGK